MAFGPPFFVPNAFRGATSVKAGAIGLTPSPAAGQQGYFLRGDGVWADPTGVTDALLAANNLSDLANALDARTNLGLGAVENTALSTWAGTSHITTVGNLSAGVVPVSLITGLAAVATSGAKADVGLGSVENTALSTWAGSANITQVGTLIGGSIPVAFVSGLAAVATSGSKSDVGLNAVENTALSTWAGSANLTTLGTITSGTVPVAHVSGLAAVATSGNKSDIGLGSVENTALSTWAGTTNITKLGSVTLGTWGADPIADAYIASAATWNAKQSALLFGDGLTNTLGTVSVDTVQNIAKLTNLAGATGWVKVLGSDGTLFVDTTTHEAALGNPVIDGSILSSDSGGTRHWLANLPVTNLNSGTGASSTSYWRGDGVWAVPAGGGNVVGPLTSVVNTIPVFNSLTGDRLAATAAVLTPAGALSGLTSLTVSGLSTANGLVQTNGSGLFSSTLTPAGLTSLGVNGISSALLSNLTLGTGTFGTSVTFASATGIPTFGTDVNFSGNAFITGYATFKFPADSWINSNDAKNRFLFTTNGTTYLKAGFNTGTLFEFRNLADTAVATISTGGNADFTGNISGAKITASAGMNPGNALTGSLRALQGDGGATGIAVNAPTGGTVYLAINGAAALAQTATLATFSTGILGSGGTAPTSTTTGSNVFTAGIATSGPAYIGGVQLLGSGTLNAGTQLHVFNQNNSGIRIEDTRVASDYAVLQFKTGASANVWQWLGHNNTLIAGVAGVGDYFTLTQTSATLAGNLTVSGYALSGTFATAGEGDIYSSSSVGNGIIGKTNTLTNCFIGASTNRDVIIGHWNGSTYVENARFALGLTTTLAGGLTFATSATNVADFTGLTKSGTSTTAAAILGKSLGLTENLWVGGTGNFANDVTISRAANTLLFVQESDATHTATVRVGYNNNLCGDFYQNTNGHVVIANNYNDVTSYIDFIVHASSSPITALSLTNVGNAVFASTTAATAYNAASVTLAGGLGVAGAIIGNGALTIAGTVIHTQSATPASASATGTVGTIAWDASYIYVCTATNTWKRVAIATW